MTEPTRNRKEPHEHPRRILLMVTGRTPQVVTETLYALSVKRDPPFIPTEVHLVTTAEGARTLGSRSSRRIPDASMACAMTTA